MADSRGARATAQTGEPAVTLPQKSFWEALREVDSLRAPPTRLCADWARSHGLEAETGAEMLEHMAPALPRIVYDALRTPVPALNEFEVDDLLAFRVPEVNEDGTCNAFSKLQVLPFRIHVAVYGYSKGRPVAATDALVRRLWRLRRVRWRPLAPRANERSAPPTRSPWCRSRPIWASGSERSGLGSIAASRIRRAASTAPLPRCSATHCRWEDRRGLLTRAGGRGAQGRTGEGGLRRGAQPCCVPADRRV